MSIRFLHFADLHFDAPNQKAALESLAEIYRVGVERKVDFWAIAGDLFNRGVANTDASGFPRLVEVIRSMLDIAPIFAIEGTKTRHDIPGCYAVLTQLRARNEFRLLDPGEMVILRNHDGEQCLIMGCPEPTREWLVAQAEGLSAQEMQGKLAEQLRGIFLGLGAKRTEHSEIPAVMLFHGAIAGATMQNQKLASGELTVGRDDLALCQADYYALGHIHAYQQISGMPAWYVDSAYPVDWAERTKKHFNLVTIETPGVLAEGMACRVERMPYPHAPRRKIEVAWGDDIGAHLPITGDLVWLSVKTPKEHCTSEDREIVLQKLLANGALDGSRVTLEPIASETVRAAEIAKKSRLRDKLIIWAEASGEQISEHVLELADWLEAQAERSGVLPTSFLYHLRSVKVRGAKGIWKGLRADDVFIDFDALDPGLIALIGFNGEGKTTLAELSHPYSRMMTREGTLQEHFRLRDSLREVTFSNDATGEWYRSRMEIDGKNKTGGAKYHLARRHSDNGNWEPISDGTRDSYDAEILRLLGSFELFTRSAFVPQRPSKTRPALYEATKGEKKDLFRELAGLDYLQAYSERAKQKAAGIEDEIVLERNRINLIESQLTALPGIVDERDKKCVEMGERSSVLSGLEERGKQLKLNAEALAAKVKDQELLQQRIDSLRNQIEQKQKAVLDAQAEIEGFQQALKQKPDAQAAVEEYERLKGQESAENERIAKISTKREQLTAEYGAAQQAHSEACRKLEATKSRLNTGKARLEGDLKVLFAQINRLAEDLRIPLEKNCPTCGQLLPDEKLEELKADRAKLKIKLDKAREEHSGIGRQIAEVEGEIVKVVFPDPPFPPDLPPINEAPLQRIRKELAGIQIDQARKTLATTQEAATRIEETTKRQEEAARELVQLQEQLKTAESQQDPFIQDQYDEAQQKLEDARREYGEAQKAISGLEAQIKSMDQRITELQASEKDITERKAKLEAQQLEAAEWRLLERGCGPDGIQALELDAMAPGISEIANNLLRSAYGPRFSLELRTTRTAGKGGKTRQVEDFAIWVLDAECPEVPEAELSMISGGEGVWIARSIADAFAMIRERNHGVKFLTVIQDEGDSALDDDPRTNARQRYFDMLEGGHAESGRIHTLVITHSPEAKDRIPQKVKMADLVVREQAHAAVA